MRRACFVVLRWSIPAAVMWVAACGGDDFNVAGSALAGAGGNAGSTGTKGGKGGSGADAADGGNAGSGGTSDTASGGSAGSILGPPCTTDADCNADPSNHCAGLFVCSPTPTGAVCVVASSPVDADDHNACTVDSCDPKSGAISHEPVAVGDNDPCTIDTCDPATGVDHTSKGAGCQGCTGADDCNDDDPCTKDSCSDAGKCEHAARAVGSNCKPATACFGASTCTETGACSPGAAKDISDDDLCTFDRCIAGTVVHEPPPLSADKCTISTCDPKTGVTATRSAADDGTACTADSCDPATGVVSHTTVSMLDDNDPCTKDTCDPSTGVVSHTSITTCTGCSSDGDCDDKLPCTVDTCSAGQCAHQNAPAKTSCANGVRCDGDEVCDGNGVCLLGTPLVQDDGDVCTTDACTEADGVTHTPVKVDDGKPCTEDGCDSATGVFHKQKADCAACSTDAECGIPLPSSCQTVTCDGGVCARKSVPAGTSCGFLSGAGCTQNLCSADATCEPTPPANTPLCDGRCGKVKLSCGVAQCPETCPGGKECSQEGYCK
jgi:hypothetical protein